MKKLVLSLAIVFIASSIALGATINLRATWTLNGEPNVALYKLYRTDGTRALIGGVTHPTNSLDFSVTVPDGSAGTLTFVVTAIDTAGKETADGPPATFPYNLIPPPPPLVPPSGLKIEEVTAPSACVYTYSAWGSCQSNNTQTRTVVSSTPAGCTGTPILTQACTYVPAVPGAIYYISPDGIATWPSCVDITTPCPISAGFANAKAGDTIYHREGTYPTDKLYSPSNSGLSNDARITFAAYPGEVPIINGILKYKVVSTAGPGTTKTTLIDNAVDFISAGVAVNDSVRTVNKQGGAWVEAIVDSHTLTLASTWNFNCLDNFVEGDAYDIGQDTVAVMGVADGTVRNYITFDGFTIMGENGKELAQIYLGGSSSYSIGNIVKNNTFKGGTRYITHGDNRDLLRIDHNSNVLVQGNKFQDHHYVLENAYVPLNIAAIKMYRDDHVTITGNEFANLATAIFAKSGLDYQTYTFNYIHDVSVGIESSTNVGAQTNGTISGNLIANAKWAGISIRGTDASITNWTVDSNTLRNSSLAIAPGQNFAYGGLRVFNNIIETSSTTGANAGYRNPDFPTGTPTILDECDFNNYGTHMRLSYKNDLYTALPPWRLIPAITGGLFPDLRSLAIDPKFSNTSGMMSQLSDFTLAPDSPCKGIGKGGTDMGADISKVGIKK